MCDFIECQRAMEFRVGALWFVAASVAFSTLASCSPVAFSPGTVSPASERSNAGTRSVYAFAPDKPLLAVYADGTSPAAKPISVLRGRKTHLSAGNGMAVGSDGTIYFVVYDAASSGSPLDLLTFAPGARGDARPERTAVLNGPLLPGYAPGLALDGQGNFWISDIGRLLRFPASESGSVSPNASIRLKLSTPDGMMLANASNVALDSAGHIYCACHVVYQGAQASGVTEYAADAKGRFRIVRSFYDLNLPEVPPGSIAVDGSGTIYLASSLPNTGVFAYRAGHESGNVTYSRRFTTGSGLSIASLATDTTGQVYVAAASSILVFGPNADGRVHPVRTIRDRRHLHFTTADYGTLLDVR